MFFKRIGYKPGVADRQFAIIWKEHGATRDENKAEREREAVSDVLILHLWTGYPSPTTGLCGRMNRRICFAVVFGGGDGDGGLVGRLFKLSLSWGPITWNQKSWEEWGQ